MQLDYNTKEGIAGLLERILDSPYECDKWRTEAEKAYKFFGGANPRLIAPTLRERMAAKLIEDKNPTALAKLNSHSSV